MTPDPQHTASLVAARLGCAVRRLTPVAGGSINRTWRLEKSDGALLFVKQNSASQFPQLLSAERDGLNLLSGRQLIRTPNVIDQWEEAGQQFLVLEWIEAREPDTPFWQRFGTALAQVHTNKGPAFGAVPDNYMGAVPQSNRSHDRWADFFIEERLLPVARKCAAKNLLPESRLASVEGLRGVAADLFGNPAPALLHGDLWSGNFLCAADGPVLIDPAVYYGHPAMDLGMTTLFGGFEPEFYAAYHEADPLPPNHREQWELANLYPLLIHLLLFGHSYRPAIEETLRHYQ